MIVMILFDRGAADGLGFCTEQQFTDAAEAVNLEVRRDTLRFVGMPQYNLILHLESLAAASSEGLRLRYSNHSLETNTVRTQDTAAASESDQTLGTLYGAKPQYSRIAAASDFQSKLASVAHHINNLLEAYGVRPTRWIQHFSLGGEFNPASVCAAAGGSGGRANVHFEIEPRPGPLDALRRGESDITRGAAASGPLPLSPAPSSNPSLLTSEELEPDAGSASHESVSSLPTVLDMSTVNVHRILLAGPRGSGKTSILQGLLGILPTLSQGQVRAVGISCPRELVALQLDCQAQLLGIETRNPTELSDQFGRNCYDLRRTQESSVIPTCEQISSHSHRIHSLVVIYAEGELCPYADRGLNGAIAEVERINGANISPVTWRQDGDEPYDLVCLTQLPILARTPAETNENIQRFHHGHRDIYFDNDDYPPPCDVLELSPYEGIRYNIDRVIERIKVITEADEIVWLDESGTSEENFDSDFDNNVDPHDSDDDNGDDSGQGPATNNDDDDGDGDDGDDRGGGQAGRAPSSGHYQSRNHGQNATQPNDSDHESANSEPSIRVNGPGFEMVSNDTAGQVD